MFEPRGRCRAHAAAGLALTQDINLLDASHMHKCGVHFVASMDTGQMLYDGTDWQEPKLKSTGQQISHQSLFCRLREQP